MQRNSSTVGHQVVVCLFSCHSRPSKVCFIAGRLVILKEPVIVPVVKVNHSTDIKARLTHRGCATCSGAAYSCKAYQQRQVITHVNGPRIR